jgi:Flp pilus assembly protein protease CpaA
VSFLFFCDIILTGYLYAFIYIKENEIMKKTFIVTALALGMTVPVYAAQFDNSGDKKYMAPSAVEDPNAVVAQRKYRGDFCFTDYNNW